MADANSTQYAKMVGASGVQDLLVPFEAGGKIRTAFFNFLSSGTNPAAAEFGYLTKVPKGAYVIGALVTAQAGFQASGTTVLELETADAGTYTSMSAALDTATGFVYTLDWTAAQAAAVIPLKALGQGRVRFNPSADVVTAKYLRGIIFYVVA